MKAARKNASTGGRRTICQKPLASPPALPISRAYWLPKAETTIRTNSGSIIHGSRPARLEVPSPSISQPNRVTTAMKPSDPQTRISP